MTVGHVDESSKVIRSANRAYDSSGRNITLHALQSELVKSLQQCYRPATADLGIENATIHYVLGKGDWKFKASWLQEFRNYGRLKERPGPEATFCRRCRCISDPGNMHWLDMQGLSFYQPWDVEAIMDANVPQQLPCLVCKWV